MRRRLLAVGSLAGLVTLLPGPVARAGTDFFSNIAPASPLGSAAAYARYPFSHYELDRHFTVVKASITGGVDASGILPAIAWFLASGIWLIVAFLSKAVIELFAFAFSLDLVNGSSATGGAGALGPVSQAIHSIYSNVFGAPWLILAFSGVALWAMWKALVQRRYQETAGALAMSLVYIVVAFFFVAAPGQTIGAASRWTNEMSRAFLSIPSHGSPTEGGAATSEDTDQLWSLLVTQPWTVLEFGGIEHCAIDGGGDEDSDPQSAPVRPLSKDAGEDSTLSRRLADGTEVQAEGKTCINNLNKYAPHFLRFGNSTPERDEEYEALNHGNAEELPEADDEKAGYKLGVADKPATDAMEEGGQYQRLLIAPAVALGDLGAILLLGSLAIGVVLSQVLLLLLLAFSPVALVAAAIPGRGHDFFKAWLQKLAGFLLRKAAYSLVLAILLAVDAAIGGATSQLGWLFSFGLQAAFFWAVLIQRRTLTEGIVGIATRRATPGRDLALDVAALYAGSRLARGPLRAAGSAGRGGLRWALGSRPDRAPSLRTVQAVDWSGRGRDADPTDGGGQGGSSGGGSGGPDPKPDGSGGGRGDGGGTDGAGGTTDEGGHGDPSGGGRRRRERADASTESRAGGGGPESVATPQSDAEGKTGGRGEEASTDRRPRRPARSTEAKTGDPAPESVAAPPSDPEGTAAGKSVEAGGPTAGDRLDAPKVTTTGMGPRRPRQGSSANPDGRPASSPPRTDEGTVATNDEGPRRHSAQTPSRPDSSASPGTGPAKPKPSEGPGLGDDLRAERERSRTTQPAPVTFDRATSAPAAEQPAAAAASGASPDPDEPSSPPRRRSLLRLPRVGRRGR